jgi:hypothetical protein
MKRKKEKGERKQHPPLAKHGEGSMRAVIPVARCRCCPLDCLGPTPVFVTPGEVVLAAAVDRRRCPVLPLLVVVSCVVTVPVVVQSFPYRCR